jgi:ATP-dependent Lhr-like helicase
MTDSKEIKEKLKITYVPFFSRFGSFTPIQELAIPHILKGENVVLISPAASGKTEAVIAPVIENLINDGDINDLKILYVSPTRALVNDLFRRLEEPIKYLRLTIERKTGDHPVINHKELPNILLTTPESFDSLLSRETKIFLNLRVVILDEIHLLDNTPRGDQLRILLNRLRKINKNNQYCALSATIDDLTIRERYFDNSKFLILKSEREIEYEQIHSKELTKELFNITSNRALKKILIFFNARSLAEEFSRKLNRPPFQGKVLVHHASLPKSKREEVEKAMSEASSMILLSTSTLELGIDIGDIDCVVLFRPPFSISSLLQRIGRGNRRTNKLFSLCVYNDNWERVLFEVFFESAQKGKLYSKMYQPSLSVIPQQIYSYLYQRRRIGTTLKALLDIFKPIYNDEIIRDIFSSLIEKGFIKETRGGIYYLSDKLEERIRYGKIYSNIAEVSFGEYEVYNITGGSVIGRVFYPVQKFILSGKCWEKVKILEKEKKIYARSIDDTLESTKIFEGKGAGNYNYLLAPIIKLKFFPELKANEFPFIKEGKDIHIIHFFGSLYGFLIASALNYFGIEAIDAGGKVLILKGFNLEDSFFPVPPKEFIERVLAENVTRLEDALGSGAYFYDLPFKYQVEDHFRALDIERFLQFLQAIRLIKVKSEAFKNVTNLIGVT